MCGIYGSLGKTISKKDNIKAFNQLKHRGPDDFHSITDNSNKLFSISSVRLAFQDLKHGRQPFV